MASCFSNNKTDSESDYLQNKKVKTVYCSSLCDTKSKASNIYPSNEDYLNKITSTYLQSPNWNKSSWNDLQINLVTDINLKNVNVFIQDASFAVIDPNDVMFGYCSNNNINQYRQYK
jgi:hypothetical protein